MCSGAKEDKKLPESGFLVLVILMCSGAKEDKKLPESGFLVLVILVCSGAKEDKKLQSVVLLFLCAPEHLFLQQPCRRLCTSSSRRLSMAAQEAPPLSLKPAEGLLIKYTRQQLCMPPRPTAGLS